MAKSAKSTLKPFLALIAASIVTWAVFMEIHIRLSKAPAVGTDAANLEHAR